MLPDGLIEVDVRAALAIRQPWKKRIARIEAIVGVPRQERVATVTVAERVVITTVSPVEIDIGTIGIGSPVIISLHRIRSHHSDRRKKNSPSSSEKRPSLKPVQRRGQSKPMASAASGGCH
jgi:hypothetical protein